MTEAPVAVIGIPLYNDEEHLPEAIESLLGQTFRAFRVLFVDDASSDRSREIVIRYAGLDDRIDYARNDSRLGMTRNWERTAAQARERYPSARYFAWASGHDVWHPRWLDSLVTELDGDAGLVLAYPRSVGIAGDGKIVRQSWSFDTDGLGDAADRVRVLTRGMKAGDMIYGLFRTNQMADVPFRSVLLPDRLFLVEMGVRGRFRQVPETLWYRRVLATASLQRQRRAFFPGRTPFYSYLPPWLVHATVLVAVALRRGHGDAPGRSNSLGLALEYAGSASRLHFRRRWLDFKQRFVKPVRRARHRIRKVRKRVIRRTTRTVSHARVLVGRALGR